jgi:hypothetical protein
LESGEILHLCQFNINKIDVEINKKPRNYKSFRNMRSIIFNILMGTRMWLCESLLSEKKYVHTDAKMKNELIKVIETIKFMRTYDEFFFRLVNDHATWAKLQKDEQEILRVHRRGELAYVKDINEAYSYMLQLSMLCVKIDKIVKNMEIHENEEVVPQDNKDNFRLMMKDVQKGNVKLEPHKDIKIQDNIPMVNANCPRGYIPNFKSKKCQVCKNRNTLNTYTCDDWTYDKNTRHLKDACDGLTRDYNQYNVSKSSNDTQNMEYFEDFYDGTLSNKKNTACMFNNARNYGQRYKHSETTDNEWDNA